MVGQAVVFSVARNQSRTRPTRNLIYTVDGQDPCRTTLKQLLKPLFAGTYVGESNHSVPFLKGGAKWTSPPSTVGLCISVFGTPPKCAWLPFASCSAGYGESTFTDGK